MSIPNGRRAWPLLALAVFAGACAARELSQGATEIPAAFHGEWAADAEACAARSHESRLSIRAGEVSFYESRGRVIEVRPSSPQRIEVSLQLTGEGQTWQSTREFVLSDEGRQLTDVGGLVRTRCRAGAGRPSLPDPLEAGWNGVPVCEKLHEDADGRILRCSFPPSVGHERHFHDRHFGYAIAGGRMRITDSSGAREVDLAAGSSFTSDGVAWHEVVNIGDSTVTYLIVEPK